MVEKLSENAVVEQIEACFERFKIYSRAAQWPMSSERRKMLCDVLEFERGYCEALCTVAGRCTQLAYYVEGGALHDKVGFRSGQTVATCGDIVAGVRALCADCAKSERSMTPPNMQWLLNHAFWADVERWTQKREAKKLKDSKKES